MSDQDTTLALIASLKLNQKGILTSLRDEVKTARKAGNIERAKALTKMIFTLTQQNPILHRAEQLARQTKDLNTVNRKLMRIVTESNKVHLSLEATVDVREQAVKLVALLRQTVNVFT